MNVCGRCMFDELENLNIETCSYSELKALIRQTLPVVVLHSQAVEELLHRNDNNDSSTSTIEMAKQPIAIVNGSRLSQEKFASINENNFDIILDLTTNRLLYRKDPATRSPLKNANLKGIGPRRIEILMHLLEHPKQYISVENVSVLPRQCDVVEPNTLSQTIGLIRKALEQKDSKGPYIITEPSLGSSHHIYKINTKWNYLVIEEK